MQSSVVQSRIRQKANGTTVLGIKQSNLRKVLFPLPDMKTQNKTASLCDSLAAARVDIECNGEKLETLRTSLINNFLP